MAQDNHAQANAEQIRLLREALAEAGLSRPPAPSGEAVGSASPALRLTRLPARKPRRPSS